MAKKKVIVRAIDIEVWHGHQQAALWDVVDDLIFIANHVRDLVEPQALPSANPNMKIHTIPCAVDLDKWTFRTRQPNGKLNIAVVSERWLSKGVTEILQIAYKLKKMGIDHQITWLGQRSDYPWEHVYRDDFAEFHDLNIEFVNILHDDDTVDHFLEDKDFLLHGSHKEAFCYAIAEAMAKGIKPVPHRFYGADDIWPGITWNSIDEAIEMLTNNEYHSASYRQYLIDKGYTLPQMMAKIEQVIKGE